MLSVSGSWGKMVISSFPQSAVSAITGAAFLFLLTGLVRQHPVKRIDRDQDFSAYPNMWQLSFGQPVIQQISTEFLLNLVMPDQEFCGTEPFVLRFGGHYKRLLSRQASIVAIDIRFIFNDNGQYGLVLGLFRYS